MAAMDIYQMLAGGMPGPVPQYRRPSPMAMWQDAIQGARNVEVPQALASWEQGLQGDMMGGMLQDTMGAAFQEAGGGIPGRIEEGWRQGALSQTGATDVLGANVGAPMGQYADNVYASLALAGQDTGVAESLRQIGQSSGRVLDAIGAGTITNLLENQIAGGQYGRELMSIGQSGISGAASGGGGLAGAQQRASASGGPDLSAAYDRVNQDLGQGLADQAQLELEYAKMAEDSRRNVASMAMDALKYLRGESSDIADTERDIYEDERDFAYDVSQDQAAAAADAADAALSQQEERAAGRDKAVKARQASLDALEADALDLAADLAEGYEAQAPDPNGIRGDTIKVQRKYTPGEAYKQILAALKAKYASQIRRGGIKEAKLREIAKRAVQAKRGQFANPSEQAGAAIGAVGAGLY